MIRRQAGFLRVKKDIEMDISRIHGRIKAVVQKLQENMRTEVNPNGYFTQNPHDYFKCLELGYSALDQLFQKDEAYWQQNLEKAKEKFRKVHQEMLQLKEKYQKDLEIAMQEHEKREKPQKAITIRDI